MFWGYPVTMKRVNQSDSNDLVIDEPDTSEQYGRIYYDTNGIYTNGSINNTFVFEYLLDEPPDDEPMMLIFDSDSIKCGSTMITASKLLGE